MLMMILMEYERVSCKQKESIRFFFEVVDYDDAGLTFKLI